MGIYIYALNLETRNEIDLLPSNFIELMNEGAAFNCSLRPQIRIINGALLVKPTNPVARTALYSSVVLHAA